MLDDETPRFAVGGFTPFSAADWPDRLTSVVFAQGCPLRCGYCHNPHLIPPGIGSMQFASVLKVLEKRAALIDGVVFSGGEPCAQRGLTNAIDAVRELGLSIGLHTSGVYPAMLERVLPKLDWIGLDVKAPPGRFSAVTGASAWPRLERSVAALVKSGREFEARTTWHPDLFSEARLFDLAQMLSERGVAHYAVQRLRTAEAGHGPARWVTGPAPSARTMNRLAQLFVKASLR